MPVFTGMTARECADSVANELGNFANLKKHTKRFDPRPTNRLSLAKQSAKSNGDER
jgi:hypothetical protein